MPARRGGRPQPPAVVHFKRKTAAEHPLLSAEARAQTALGASETQRVCLTMDLSAPEWGSAPSLVRGAQLAAQAAPCHDACQPSCET